MPDALETAALSGALFRDDGPPSPTHTDDELGSDLSPPSSPEPTRRALRSSHDTTSSSTTTVPNDVPLGVPEHDGPRTGPKGVMSDSRAHAAAVRDRQRQQVAETRRAQERAAITVPSFREEELAARMAAMGADGGEGDGGEDGDGLEGWRQRRMEQLRGAQGLREVGKSGFLGAVERRGWVVVVIYEADVPLCPPILASALRLALLLPRLRLSEPVAIVRARATKLGYGLLPTPTNGRDANGDMSARVDGYDSDSDDDNSDSDDEGARARADPDVLPTMLAYRNGELEHTWVRVDLEGDLEALLRREGVVRETKADGDESD